MKVVVDTNIVFSAMLNTNSKIAKILLHPKSTLNFYTTDLLLLEIDEHRMKLKKLTGYSDI
jgi:predicted nucleic acid-binding protein